MVMLRIFDLDIKLQMDNKPKFIRDILEHLVWL